MGRTVRTLVCVSALAVVYACSSTAPGEGGSSSSGGSSASSSGGGSSSGTSSSGSSGDAATDATASTDSAPSSDGSVVTEGGSSDASPDAIADAAPDASVDAATDGGTCPVMCVAGTFADGRPAPPPGGSSELCTGGCSWYGGSIHSEYRNVCHMTCGGACAPDPPYAGVCPAECNGGCADGVCNITCGGAGLPSCAPPRPADATNPYYFGVLKCPDGLPCKVTCLEGLSCPGVVACPRDAVSCEIDCGFTAYPELHHCAQTHFYCGAGPCKIIGEIPGVGAAGRGAAPEYNMALDVCGHACSCDIPYPALADNGAGTRCLCKDGTIFKGISPPGEDRCPAKCATHGGWSVPWERTPYSY